MDALHAFTCAIGSTSAWKGLINNIISGAMEDGQPLTKVITRQKHVPVLSWLVV